MALNKPKIVVLGAGYGGLMTVTRLPKHIGANDADITLVNKHNYHYETTWMHEASAGTLHHDRCRYQIKDVINESRVKFVQDTVKAIDVQNKKVTLSQGDIPYDYLVIGLGAVPETFGIKGLKEFAFPIANINTSRQLKDHIELQFATYNTEAEKRPDRLTIVVGGAGFTGIEFLGELANRKPELCRYYDIDESLVRIVCVEAARRFCRDLIRSLSITPFNTLRAKALNLKSAPRFKNAAQTVSQSARKMKNRKKSNRRPLSGPRACADIRSWRKRVLKICAAVSRSTLIFGRRDMMTFLFSATARSYQ